MAEYFKFWLMKELVPVLFFAGIIATIFLIAFGIALWEYLVQKFRRIKVKPVSAERTCPACGSTSRTVRMFVFFGKQPKRTVYTNENSYQCIHEWHDKLPSVTPKEPAK